MGYFWGQELYHWGRSKTNGAPGRGSGRYPLGSGDRPYQSQPRLLSKFRKKKKSEEPPVQKTREEILISGSPKEVATLLRKATNNELEYIIQRFDKEAKIKQIIADDVYANSTEKTLKDIGAKIKLTTDMIKVGTDFYNTLANIYNATDAGKKKPLTTIGQGGGGKDKGKKAEGKDESKNNNFVLPLPTDTQKRNKNRWI